MKFIFEEQQQAIKDLAAKFAAKELFPQAASISQGGGIPETTLSKMGEIGLLGLIVPPPFGGGGCDTVSFVSAVEEVAAASPSAGIVMSAHATASFAVLAFGQNTVKMPVLTELASGKTLGAIAVTEPDSGSDTLGIMANGVKIDGGYKVSGRKIFISNARNAKYFVILFRTSSERSPQSLTLGLFQKGSPGLTIGKKENTVGLRGDEVAEVILEDYLIADEYILGETTNGLMSMLAAASLAALGTAATAIGAARELTRLSTNYIKERACSGVPIANQQIIQIYLSEMITAVETARLALQRAAWGRDQGDRSPVAVWTARTVCVDMALRAAELAQKIFASYGYTYEYPVANYVHDIQGVPYLFGTQELLKIYISKSALGLPLFV